MYHRAIRIAFALDLGVFCVFASVLPAQTTQPAAPGIAAQLQPFVDSNVIAGAVTLIAGRDKVLDVTAVGFMDLAAKKPMRADCMFWIASQSKPITATALMILVDEGKVNVDDPVEKYLPEFKGQTVAVGKDAGGPILKAPVHPITVKNVLSHTSGLPFKSDLEQPTLDLFPLAQRVKSYAAAPLMFQPDSNYAYSNAGINTAGRIIEVVSGMKYEEFLSKRIFEPLGMKDTTFWPNQEQLARLARAYKSVKGGLEECPVTQLKYPLDDPNRQPMPAGGLFSTASDLCIFYQMLANGGQLGGKRIVSEQAVKQMTSRQTGELKSAYGFGFTVGGGIFGHGGAYGTNSSYNPTYGLIMIYLVQHGGGKDDSGKAQQAFHKAAARYSVSPSK